jgi:hypothetical protein
MDPWALFVRTYTLGTLPPLLLPKAVKNTSPALNAGLAYLLHFTTGALS